MTNDVDLKIVNNFENRAVSVRIHLKRLVSSGSFAPQEKLNAKQIADAIGVSVTPVREALISLFAEGVIDKTPGQGYFTKSVQYESQCEYYEFFLAISEFSLRNYLDNLVFQDLINPLAGEFDVSRPDVLPTQAHIDDYDRYLMSLYRELAASTKNGKIICEMNQFIESTKLVREIDIGNIPRLREINDDMMELIQLVKDRKGDRAIKNLNHQVRKKIKIMPTLTRQANGRFVMMRDRNGRIA